MSMGVLVMVDLGPPAGDFDHAQFELCMSLRKYVRDIWLKLRGVNPGAITLGWPIKFLSLSLLTSLFTTFLSYAKA